MVGATAAAGAAAVVGATDGVAGAYAGAFYGSVVIGGDLIVVGGAKSAAVPFTDGSHRQLYCVESPESWFEDFGQGKLIDGCAEVAIEPGFGAVADMSEYQVFLTSYAEDLHLHVSRRTPTGFTVETDAGLAALKGRARADLGGAFGWRVVARRKDIAGERLAVVHMPPNQRCRRSMKPHRSPAPTRTRLARSGGRAGRKWTNPSGSPIDPGSTAGPSGSAVALYAALSERCLSCSE